MPSTEETQQGSARERGLLRIAIFGLSAGIGLGIVIAIVLGVSYCRSSRPKPWSNAVISASFDHIDAESDSNGNPKTFFFHYILQNNSDRDYRIRDSSQLLIMLRHGDSLRQASDATVTSAVFMTPQQRADLILKVPYATALSIISSKDLIEIPLEELKRMKPAAKKHFDSENDKVAALVPQELEGFVLYDEGQRYSIALPKGW